MPSKASWPKRPRAAKGSSLVVCAKKNVPVTYPPLIFNVYKPVGMTSFEVVNHFKRHLPAGFGKIGHFGTLDPFAEGVLLIGVAGASRLANIMNECMPKTYEATGLIGVKTDTGDHTGQVIWRDQELEQRPFLKLSDMELDSIFCGHFLGDYWQRPQAFSAAKHEGKPLYEYARAGVMIEKDAVLRQIYKIEVQHFELPYLKFQSEVGSGTYIRVLFEDMMALFETSGSLSSLKRIAIGPHHERDSLREDRWPFQGCYRDGSPYLSMQEGTEMTAALPLRKAFLTAAQHTRYLSGIFPPAADVEWQARAVGLADAGRELCWVYVKADDGEVKLVGLAQWSQQGHTPNKVIFNLAQ